MNSSNTLEYLEHWKKYKFRRILNIQNGIFENIEPKMLKKIWRIQKRKEDFKVTTETIEGIL